MTTLNRMEQLRENLLSTYKDMVALVKENPDVLEEYDCPEMDCGTHESGERWSYRHMVLFANHADESPVGGAVFVGFNLNPPT